MSAKRALLVILAASLVVLAVGVGPQVAGTARALDASQASNGAGVSIPYPGRLSDDAGQPVAEGTYDFTFALYEAESAGEPLWSEVQEGVPVQDGAFAVSLGSVQPIPSAVLDGRALWLGVGVRGPGEAEFTALSPRQMLSASQAASIASPKAGGACPHDHTGEVWTSSEYYGLKVETTVSDGRGLYGVANSGTLAEGVYGESYRGRGVYGWSTNGIGVYAEGGAGERFLPALRVNNYNTTNGMATYMTNESSYHTAHFQNSGSGGVLFLQNNGDTNGAGGGDFITAVGKPVGSDMQFRITSDGTGYADGGWQGAADFAELMTTEGPAMAYEPGDVLVISAGLDRSAALSSEPYSTLVLGVYSETPGFIGSPDAMQEQRDDQIPVAMVGIVPCKVSTENGPIGRGNLLVTASTPGHAMRADNPPPGTILGKALEPLNTGTGVIQILVTLQ
jgi:hypothetical protein